jgi:hypothetical protein
MNYDKPESESDFVWGFANIAREIGKPPHQGHYLCIKGRLPVRKVGDQWVGKRSELRDPSKWPGVEPSQKGAA